MYIMTIYFFLSGIYKPDGRLVLQFFFLFFNVIKLLPFHCFNFVKNIWYFHSFISSWLIFNALSFPNFLHFDGKDFVAKVNSNDHNCFKCLLSFFWDSFLNTRYLMSFTSLMNWKICHTRFEAFLTQMTLNLKPVADIYCYFNYIVIHCGCLHKIYDLAPYSLHILLHCKQAILYVFFSSEWNRYIVKLFG